MITAKAGVAQEDQQHGDTTQAIERIKLQRTVADFSALKQFNLDLVSVLNERL